ncbi:MAG: asparagine synthase (glutamine-hydrolyzing) [Chloroherpetonaceae bacterium]|nr:asparagine synthase (glutamine-hydrolyzing) [Chthonomonadaceae bacterium]MDW8209084.1 asparagine synthase (glutamine-hydrolyzing) [Chloroherpetonaceae bacterium]
MCGLAGFLDPVASREQGELLEIVREMAATLAHRGPDDAGAWADPATGYAVGFRRLAIVDLSPAGHQPMLSASGRYVIAFNGEVYNFRALRAELEAAAAPAWKGHSDTEVVLASIEHWGVEPAVRRFIGMYAFALWDRQERTLYLVRDRIGVKPLYYGWAGGTFLFGSELKALRAFPEFRPAINRNALALYLRHNYIPAPYSIYECVSKLPPGSILKLPTGTGTPEIRPYWSMHAVVEAGMADPFTGSDAEAIEQLDALLRDAVRLRMIADVPLGVFLSGGIDSSVVTALMQAQSSRPVRTFTIGFREDDYNEAVHARAVAEHLGTEHTELYVSPAEALAVIPRLPALYDEPFADSSQIPTFLVSALAREKVTVALSGDGGDEFFGGYNRYFWGRDIWRWTGWVPVTLRSALGNSLTRVSPEAWERFFRAFMGRLRPRNPGHKVYKVAEMLQARTPEALYMTLISRFKDPGAVLPYATEPPTVLTDRSRWPPLADFTPRMMFLDAVSYLPDDILVKVDRASMGISLEAREPLLDHRVVEFAWRLPLHLKIRGGRGKWALRQVLYRYVPAALVERPKTGFGVPVEQWLRGPLRDWAEALLDATRLHREGIFDVAAVRCKWSEHLSGRRNWQDHIWEILMFQAWLESQRPATIGSGG